MRNGNHKVSIERQMLPKLTYCLVHLVGLFYPLTELAIYPIAICQNYVHLMLICIKRQ